MNEKSILKLGHWPNYCALYHVISRTCARHLKTANKKVLIHLRGVELQRVSIEQKSANIVQLFLGNTLPSSSILTSDVKLEFLISELLQYKSSNSFVVRLFLVVQVVPGE